MARPFSMEKVPEQFQGFVKDKQLQLFNNVLTSGVAGLVIANCISLIAGDASTDIVLETTKASLPLLAFTSAAIIGTTISKTE